jgi:hypothetical protein
VRVPDRRGGMTQARVSHPAERSAAAESPLTSCVGRPKYSTDEERSRE